MNLQKAGMSLFFVLLLFSCGKVVPPENGENGDGNLSGEHNNSSTITYSTYGIKSEQFEKLKSEMTIEDMSTVFLKESKNSNPIAKMGIEFVKKLETVNASNIINHSVGGITSHDLSQVLSEYDPSLVRSIQLELQIQDYKTHTPIKKGTVFLNGVNIGSFSDGKYSGSFQWLQGIELFNILVRNPEYGDAVVVLNSLNSRGELLMGDVLMKKATTKQVTLGKAQTISLDKVTIKLKDCTLVDLKGECYTGKAEAKVNFITGNDANQNQLSLNMSAITIAGKMVYLQSGGMAFIDFITPDGEILQLKSGDTIEFSYRVSPQDILNMSNTKYGNGESNGYWYYNKLAGIWQESTAKTVVNSKNNTVTITADVLY